MRLGKLAVIGLAALVGLGLGLIVAQPWHGPTDVEAVELDDEKAWREDDGSDAEVREDDGDDADPGIRRRSLPRTTDDGRDGPDGTRAGRGTGPATMTGSLGRAQRQRWGRRRHWAASASAAVTPESDRGQERRTPSSARDRASPSDSGAFVLLMATATLVSVVLVRQALLTGLDDRIDEALVQESRELRRLATDGVDPETGEPFRRNVRRVFEVFLERNVPDRNEAFLTFVGGELYLRSRHPALPAG
jgi:hypothetical protein